MRISKNCTECGFLMSVWTEQATKRGHLVPVELRNNCYSQPYSRWMDGSVVEGRNNFGGRVKSHQMEPKNFSAHGEASLT